MGGACNARVIFFHLKEMLTVKRAADDEDKVTECNFCNKTEQDVFFKNKSEQEVRLYKLTPEVSEDNFQTELLTRAVAGVIPR